MISSPVCLTDCLFVPWLVESLALANAPRGCVGFFSDPDFLLVSSAVQPVVSSSNQVS